MGLIDYISAIPNVVLTWATFFGAGAFVLMIILISKKKLPPPKEIFRICVPFDPIRSKSFHSDLKIKILRKLFDPFLIIPELVVIVAIGSAINGLLKFSIGDVSHQIYNNNAMIACVAVMVVIEEFSFYVFHYMEHKVPFLWEFHKVHHSAEILNPLTDARAHILPMFLRTLVVGIICGLPVGLFAFFFKIDMVKLTLVTGITIGAIRYITLYPLKHSHFAFGFGPLDWIIQSPHMHQVHHSSKKHHWDKNFGVNLSIFDWIFGTGYRPAKGETVELGLSDDSRDEKYDTLWDLYVEPVKRSVRTLRKPVKSARLTS